MREHRIFFKPITQTLLQGMQAAAGSARFDITSPLDWQIGVSELAPWHGVRTQRWLSAWTLESVPCRTPRWSSQVPTRVVRSWWNPACTSAVSWTFLKGVTIRKFDVINSFKKVHPGARVRLNSHEIQLCLLFGYRRKFTGALINHTWCGCEGCQNWWQFHRGRSYIRLVRKRIIVVRGLTLNTKNANPSKLHLFRFGELWHKQHCTYFMLLQTFTHLPSHANLPSTLCARSIVFLGWFVAEKYCLFAVCTGVGSLNLVALGVDMKPKHRIHASLTQGNVAIQTKQDNITSVVVDVDHSDGCKPPQGYVWTHVDPE